MSVVLPVILAVVVALVAVVLFTPITMNASCTVSERELDGTVELSWGPRLVTARIGSGGDGRLHVFRVPTVRLTSIFERRKDTQRERSSWKLAGVRDVDVRALCSMFRRGFRAMHPSLHVRGVIGLGDPADTAIVVTGLRFVERVAGDGVRLEIVADFFEDATQLVGRIEAWLLPAEIAGIVMLWMVRPDTRRVLLRG